MTTTLRVVVIGGDNALVGATVRAFGDAGARVAVADIAALVEPQAVAQAIDEHRRHLSGLDAVVADIRPQVHGAALAIDPHAWSDAVERPLAAALWVAQSMAGPAGDGATSRSSVVYLSTVDAFHAYPGRVAAATLATGLQGMVRGLAIEMAHRGVRVNAVAAGPSGGGTGVDSVAMRRALLRSPLHRLVTPEGVARCAVFLASPRASFVTGQTVRVDGGWAALNQAPEGLDFQPIPLDGTRATQSAMAHLPRSEP